MSNINEILIRFEAGQAVGAHARDAAVQTNPLTGAQQLFISDPRPISLPPELIAQILAAIDMPPPVEGQPDPVPTAVSRRQGQLALHAAGLLDDAEALIAAIEDPAERRTAQIEYDATMYERSNPFLQRMWEQLGGTPDELDDLFRQAITL